jgi:hypothetical protein
VTRDSASTEILAGDDCCPRPNEGVMDRVSWFGVIADRPSKQLDRFLGTVVGLGGVSSVSALSPAARAGDFPEGRLLAAPEPVGAAAVFGPHTSTVHVASGTRPG